MSIFIIYGAHGNKYDRLLRKYYHAILIKTTSAYAVAYGGASTPICYRHHGHENRDSLLSLRGAERRSNPGGGRSEIASLRSQRHGTATPAKAGIQGV
ncbi:MAG: hypothetical protein SVO26_08210 [Chloroflexota bacterium]|nr:hypothetical protein [Chloroflexota bacterium]